MGSKKTPMVLRDLIYLFVILTLYSYCTLSRLLKVALNLAESTARYKQKTSENFLNNLKKPLYLYEFAFQSYTNENKFCERSTQSCALVADYFEYIILKVMTNIFLSLWFIS